jgi:hypothetical protein
MELLEFRKEIIETVKSIALAEGDFDRASFIKLMTQKLIESEELDDFEPSFWEGIGRRNRRLCIDGYSLDHIDESIKLVIAEYSGTDAPETLTLSEVERLFDRLMAFADEALAGRLHPVIEESMPVYSIAKELWSRKDDLRRVQLYLISDKILSRRVKDLPKQNVGGIVFEFHVWDISRFHRVFESHTGRDDLFIDFNSIHEGGIPCLEASQPGAEYQAYLCVMPGPVLAQIYDTYGSRLLEGNVRSFLSTKGKVNKGIRNTILNNPEMFFAYNNGIAATATEVRVENTPTGLRLTQCKDLQIVNGGQTTASLLMARLKDKACLDEIFVPMKLSVISPEKAETVIPEIARCANSQNKVSDADFFSNHPFHIRIESMSRRLWAPAVGGSQLETRWFYERARGQYLNEQSKLTPSEKKRFLYQYPRTQVITKTDLAKYRNAWAQLPHVVCLGAQKNFIRFAEWVSKIWEEKNTEIDEEFFRESVALAILYKHTEKLVSQQPWYENGYRAQIVAYTVAKLSSMVDKSIKGKTLDLRMIWNNQSVSTALEQQLVLIAKEAHDVIIHPEPGFGNISEWCKKERCWRILEAREIPLLPAFLDELVDVHSVKSSKKESRAQQYMDNGIEAQVHVVKLGADYWKKLLSWATQRNLITREEESLIRCATRLGQGVVPTDKQSIRLLALKERISTEGFAG